jgi:hypothetical protein
MLLMQILSTLVRQWRECRMVERILVALLVSGLVVSLVASALYGALATAAAFGLIVLCRTGLFTSRYQRKAMSALKPLRQVWSEERQRDRNLAELAEKVMTTGIPLGCARSIRGSLLT